MVFELSTILANYHHGNRCTQTKMSVKRESDCLCHNALLASDGVFKDGKAKS